jgi:YaiO family outer membrane protein
MMNFRHIKLAAFLLTVTFTSGLMFPQTISNPEEEYSRIRTLAFDGRYEEAEPAAWLLVRQFPGFGDARVLLGRIIAWQGRYDEATAVIDTLLRDDPDNSDAVEAITDIMRWSRDRSRMGTATTDVRAGYMFDTYSDPFDRYWQVMTAGAGHRFSWGTAVASVNYGRISTGPPSDTLGSDFQFAAEAWPVISGNNYAYVAYAFSDGPWFPHHRAALELWQSMPAGWAASAGMNYYYFDRSIFLGTVSLEKYLGDYWFSGRVYFHFKDIGVTTSFFLNARRYFGTTDYLQLTLGTGTAPDEPYDIITDLERQKATSARIGLFKQINRRWAFRLGAGYSYEKLDESLHRNRFEGNIGIIMGLEKSQ